VGHCEELAYVDSNFQVGDWLVAPKLNSLSSNSKTVRVEPKVMQVLVCLAEAGDVVSKDGLMRKVWADTFVTDDVLTRCISELRKALADDPKRPQYIQTIPKGGYRLIAPVRLLEARNGGVKALAPTGSPPDTSAAVAPKARTGRHGLLTILIVGAAVLAVGVYWMVKRPSSRLRVQLPAAQAVSAPRLRTSVAVLPFTSHKGAGEDDFGVEVADALTTKLSESTHLVVTPTSTVLQYSDQAQDAAAAGKALNVDYVLAGEVDRSRHNVKVQVMRIRDGAPLLVNTLNQKFTNIFDLEDSLGPRILYDLMVTLDHEEAQRFRKRYTENPEAYRAFLEAHYFMNKPQKEDKLKSIQYFEKAVALDPKYAMAYAGLSDCYMRLGNHGVAPAVFVPKSRAAVMKALELDDTVAYAHSMLGRIAFTYDWDFDRAGHEYQRTRELEPSLVHVWFGTYLLVENKPAEGEQETQKFSDFLPFAPSVYFAQYYFWVRRYDRAAEMLQKQLERRPGSASAHVLLGSVYEQQGRNTEALAEFQKARQLSPQEPSAPGALGHLYATTGRTADALAMFQELNHASRHGYVSPFSRALIDAGLGRKNEAIDELEKAFEERSLLPPALKCDPRLDNLRGDPRFQDFIRRTTLPQPPS
jgi:DNA-binding winged helix-turn-helix (wHTH) protein/tetratricopeptide (TPR) repeat protein